MRKQSKAFTLIELMMVVVIIGILSTVAFPAYQKYVVQSKMAEAYSIMSVIQKNQFSYFGENREFYHNDTPLPQYLRQPMVIQADSDWEAFGYPVSPGSQVLFSYRAFAGKMDASGTQLNLVGDSVSGNGFVTIDENGYSRGHATAMGPICNSGLVSGENMGVALQRNYDWAIIYAVGDLNGEEGSLCTGVVKLLEASASRSSEPSARGFITLNMGQ
jgi:prepilin-type N-terminal cleavage/methylation domain-containing protein